MVMERKYYHYSPQNTAAITMSQGELRDILQCIESEFLESEIYLRTLTGIGNIVGESAASLSSVLKSLGREAIRLTFREFTKHCNIVAVTEEEKLEAELLEQNSLTRYSQGDSMPSNSSKLPLTTTDPIAQESHPPEANSGISSNSQGVNFPYYQSSFTNSIALSGLKSDNTRTAPPPKARKLSKRELAIQLATQKREQGLKDIGEILYQKRLQQGLSIYHLHTITFIPIHQIAALESADLKALPEDIYLRGFIHRLAKALELDGQFLLQKLPQIDATKTVLPSWYHSKTIAGGTGYLAPIHLYLGYTTLLAGALGGLAMISPQEVGQLAPDTLVPPTDLIPQQNFSPDNNGARDQHKSVNHSIAPPESIF